MKTRQIIELFIHLEHATRAGVPLRQSVAAAAQENGDRTLRRIMADIHLSLSEGESLQNAAARHPRLFDPAILALIASGESTGRLSHTFQRCQDIFRLRDTRCREMRAATRQPKIITFVLLCIAVLRDGFSSLTVDMALMPICVVGIYLLLTRTSAGRGIALQIGIYMPIIGRLITVAALARFSENLAGLYSGGIDLRRGLKTAAEITEPASLRRQLQAAAQQVAAGKPLDVAFHNVTGIDSMALAMLRTGERSGNLSLTLQEVVLYYDQQVDAALTALRQYTGPVLIVGLGYILYRYF